jgi:glycosyltransferase involved in cell wall biosynthesis
MLPALVDYLRETRPDDLISAFPYQNLLAVAGRRAAGAGTRVVITERSTTTALASRRLKWKRRSLPALVRRSYLMASAVVAVSNGLADLLASQLGLPRDKIATVYSPIVSEELVAAPAEPVDRPWFRVGEPPVAFGFGHLTEQKDFPTFVPVCNDAALATRASRVFLFRHLPSARQSSAAIARAARAKSWKGAGTAGLGDDQAMAQAILAALKNPGDRASRIARGQQFSVDRAVDRYLGLFRSAGLGLTFGRRSARAAPELAAS